jgi:hypothetical protein
MFLSSPAVVFQNCNYISISLLKSMTWYDKYLICGLITIILLSIVFANNKCNYRTFPYCSSVTDFMLYLLNYWENESLEEMTYSSSAAAALQPTVGLGLPEMKYCQ